MKAAILEGNTVVNILRVDRLEDRPGAIDGAGARRGDTWDGSTFTTPPKVPQVPATVERFQLYQALRATGQLPAVRLWLNTASEPTQLYFETKGEIARRSAAVEEMRLGLGRTNAQVDALFIAAERIGDD